MKKIPYHIIFPAAFLLIFFLNAQAQTTYKNQDELKKKADEYFVAEDYESAMPLYSQLVSIYPKDPAYNYRFGVCLIYADRRDNEKPIKYLELASSKTGVDDAVFYYLGLAYHQNYRFADAIKEYDIYKDKAGNKSVEKLDVVRQIEICNNAKSLLTHISDLYVLQKTEVVTNDFFRSYDVERFGGKILVKPDIFKTPLDKKNEKFSLCFFSKESNEVYYSSYGKDGKTGKDIYKSTKEKDGSWSKPENLGTTINTIYDEDFPFMLSDGATLYFSSKGRNTIGGYDIFNSTMGDDGIWSSPENMNYPVNTPFDDIMFVPDSSGKYAYFSSERASMEGMITVYRVRLDTRPEINEVLVFDKPDESSGNDSSYAQTLQFLKEKSTLEVNATESMFEQKDKTVADNSVNNNQDNSNEVEIPDNMTNQDIINLAEKQALQSKKELTELKTKRDAAKTIAANRKTQSENKYKEAAAIISNAETNTDENSKKTQLSKASTTRSEAEQLKKESVIATSLADQLDKQVAVKQKESDEASQYAKEIKTAVQSNSIDSSIALLERMTEKLQNSPADTNYFDSDPNADYINKKAKEAETLYTQSKALEEEITSLQNQSESYKKQAGETKKKTLKEEYLKKAGELEAEVKTKQSELDEVLQKTEKVQYEGDSARTQSSLYASVAEDIQDNNTAIKTTVTNNQLAASNTDNTATTTQNDNITANTSNDNTQTTTNNQIVTDNTNNTTTENISNDTATTTKNDAAAKNEIITQSEKITRSVNASVDSLKKLADNAYSIAYVKNEQSQKKQKEADNLKAEASEIANTDEQEKYLKKADALSKEAVELARKAVVAYSVAEYLDDSYNQKVKEKQLITELVQQAKDASNNGNTEDAQEILSEIKTDQNKITSTATIDQYTSELSNSLDSKKYEMEQAQNTADNLQSKADSLSNKAKEFREQANETKKQSQQNEFIKQAEQTEQQLTTAQKQADAALDKVENMNEEAEELKMKVNYSTIVVNETESYVKPNNTTVDKTALEKNITEYENNNVFAENATSTDEVNTSNSSTADNSANTGNVTADNTASNNNQNTVSNNVSNSNSTVNNSNTSNISTTSDVTSLTNPQLVEAKADVIDKTIVTIRTRIKALQSELKLVTDADEKENINKEIAQMQSDLTTLQEQSVVMHNEAKDMNNSQEVDNTNTDYNTLAENLQNEAVNDLDNATEKRKEANSTTDQTEKDNLRKEASELEKTAGNKTIESYEIKNIGNTSDFYNNSSIIDSVKTSDSKNTQATTADLLENEAKYYFDKAQALQKTINDSMTYSEQKSVYNDVLTNEKIAIEKQQKAIDIYKQITPTYADNTANNTTTADTNTTTDNSNAATNNNTTNIDNTNNTTSVNTNNTSNTNNAVTNNTVNTNNAVNTTTNNNMSDNVNTTTTANITTTEEAITTNEFKGIYIDAGNIRPLNVDAANLVPLDPVLPAGIVFKVQFCALNKQVAPDVFKGITPVTGESTNFGIYRYLAGLFAKYDDAVTARDLIRPMGFADAFIVAYNNGKRITVGEALALLKTDNSLATTYADLNNKAYISAGTTTAAATTATTAAKALSNPVSNIIGLFYSVQVGVYVKPVTSAQLFNITPLYDEIMANGYYRYLSGTYTNIQQAVTAKNTIVTKGVTDAFVVVYYNGKKITFAEAKTLQAGNANIAIANNNTTVNNTTTNTTTTTTNTTTVNIDISFKVQVGAYKKEVPIDIINQWLDVAVSNGLEHYVNETGLTIYTSGNFKDYNAANEYKNTLVTKGLTDAYIVAFKGKEKIAVTKAIELLK
ncbi:MAG: hypothetical protein V1904_00935 [Bacteroidota bacterium]